MPNTKFTRLFWTSVALSMAGFWCTVLAIVLRDLRLTLIGLLLCTLALLLVHKAVRNG